MRWANLVSFYRVNLPWMKRGAFESKKQTWSDYNAFVSANSKISPVFLTKGEAEQGAAVVAPYCVTKGSLPSISLVSDETNEQFVSGLFVGDLAISGATTAAQLSAALLANNNGLQEGDQISFILNLQSSSAQGVPFITARYYEFIIDSTDTSTLANLGLEGVIVADTWNEHECLCIVNGGATCGGAIILSRTTSGNIKVSTQSIVLNASAESYLANYTSDAALQRAAQSYGENEANFLAAGYSGKGSNVIVPSTQGILSVVVGNRTFTGSLEIGSDDTDFGEVTPYQITINMAQPVTEVTAAVMVLEGDTNNIPLTPVTADGTTLRCTATEFNAALGHVEIVGVRLTADGQQYEM